MKALEQRRGADRGARASSRPAARGDRGEVRAPYFRTIRQGVRPPTKPLLIDPETLPYKCNGVARSH